MQDVVMVPGLGSDATVWAKTIAALGDAVRCTVGESFQDSSLDAMADRILANAPRRFVLGRPAISSLRRVARRCRCTPPPTPHFIMSTTRHY